MGERPIRGRLVAGLAIVAELALFSSNARAQDASAGGSVRLPITELALPHARALPAPALLPARILAPAAEPTMSPGAGTACLVTGIAATVAGGAVLLVGAVLSLSRHEQFERSGSGLQDHQKTGIGMMIGGGVATAVGIPLIVVGARARPDEPEGDENASSPFAFRF